MSKWIDICRCDFCATEWQKKWDGEDYNDDFTQCPNCGECEYEIIASRDL
jgi:hypothetical protein